MEYGSFVGKFTARYYCNNSFHLPQAKYHIFQNFQTDEFFTNCSLLGIPHHLLQRQGRFYPSRRCPDVFPTKETIHETVSQRIYICHRI